jgi:F-type H+-transporting ATPase subunit b
MSLLASAVVNATRILPAVEADVDDQGYTSHHWLLPAAAEIIYAGLASVIIIGLLVWKAGPFVKKAFADRTAKIQAEIDDSARAKADAEREATRIRQALGDIESERRRLLAEADAQAEALLVDGRARLVTEIAELEAKADTDIGAAGGRVLDELRGEIARLASAAADRVVTGSLDDATQQRLIEDYIARVGANGHVGASA